MTISGEVDQPKKKKHANPSYKATKHIKRTFLISDYYWSLTRIDHFTVVCLVTWPWNEREAGVDIVLIETSLFLCKFLIISTRTASLT